MFARAGKCSRCKKYTTIRGGRSVCLLCEEKIEEEKKEKYLNDLKTLSIEDRLNRIEEILYQKKELNEKNQKIGL